MSTLPDYETFARAYSAGEAEVAVTTLVADLETPVSAYLKLARGRAGNMFLLESVEGGAQRGRYSMIGLDPDLIFRSTGERAEINRARATDPDAFVPCPGDPLDALSSLLAESRIAMPPGLPPMSAGVFGYLGYDMVRRMERLRAGQARPDRRARCAADPPDGHGRVRRRARRDRDRDPGAPGQGRRGPRGLRERAGAARRGRRRARSARSTTPPAWPSIRWSRRAKRGPTPAKPNTRRWSSRRRNISPRAMRSRSCCRSGSRAASSCPPLRFTGR